MIEPQLIISDNVHYFIFESNNEMVCISDIRPSFDIPKNVFWPNTLSFKLLSEFYTVSKTTPADSGKPSYHLTNEHNQLALSGSSYVDELNQPVQFDNDFVGKEWIVFHQKMVDAINALVPAFAGWTIRFERISETAYGWTFTKNT